MELKNKNNTNTTQPKKKYFARWLCAGRYNAEPYQSEDKDKLFVDIVEMAKENWREGRNSFFDVWSETEGEAFVRTELKGLVNTQGKVLFQTDDDEGHEIKLYNVPHLSNGKEYKGSVYFLEGNEENGLQDAGKLFAFCFGSDWGLDCGTCLAPLYYMKDGKENAFVFPEYRGRGARLEGLTLTLEEY